MMIKLPAIRTSKRIFIAGTKPREPHSFKKTYGISHLSQSGNISLQSLKLGDAIRVPGTYSAVITGIDIAADKLSAACYPAPGVPYLSEFQNATRALQGLCQQDFSEDLKGQMFVLRLRNELTQDLATRLFEWKMESANNHASPYALMTFVETGDFTITGSDFTVEMPNVITLAQQAGRIYLPVLSDLSAFSFDVLWHITSAIGMVNLEN